MLYYKVRTIDISGYASCHNVHFGRWDCYKKTTGKTTPLYDCNRYNNINKVHILCNNSNTSISCCIYYIHVNVFLFLLSYSSGAHAQSFNSFKCTNNRILLIKTVYIVILSMYFYGCMQSKSLKIS